MFERCYCLREGYDPSVHNELPDRAYDQPITNKHGESYVLDREEFQYMLKEYYVNVLHLTEEGLPPRALLKELNLNFVYPTMDEIGVWKL